MSHLFLVKAITAEVYIKVRGDSLDVAAYGVVAYHAQGGATAVAEIEMNVRVILEVRLPVRAESKLLWLGDAVFIP